MSKITMQTVESAELLAVEGGLSLDLNSILSKVTANVTELTSKSNFAPQTNSFTANGNVNVGGTQAIVGGAQTNVIGAVSF